MLVAAEKGMLGNVGLRIDGLSRSEVFAKGKSQAWVRT